MSASVEKNAGPLIHECLCSSNSRKQNQNDMKKHVMLMALMMMSTMIFAQRHKPDPKAMADKRTDKMKTELSLNDDQYSKVKTINENFALRHVQLRRDTSLTVGTVRNQMKKLRTEHQTQ